MMLKVDGWTGWIGIVSLGGVRFRAPNGANNCGNNTITGWAANDNNDTNNNNNNNTTITGWAAKGLTYGDQWLVAAKPVLSPSSMMSRSSTSPLLPGLSQ